MLASHTYLIQRQDIGTQASMDTEDTPVHDGTEREVVKDLAAVAPYVDIPVLARALVVEAVYLSDLPRLMIAANQRDTIGVSHLERKEQKERFDRVQPSVYKITWMLARACLFTNAPKNK